MTSFWAWAITVAGLLAAILLTLALAWWGDKKGWP